MDAPNEQNWREFGLCGQTDPEAFFPPKGGTSEPAKRVCGACDVSGFCLEAALAEHDYSGGILGGMTGKERRAVARARAAAAQSNLAPVELQQQVAKLHADGLEDKAMAKKLHQEEWRVANARRSLKLAPNKIRHAA